MDKTKIISFIQEHLQTQLSDYVDELQSVNEEIGKETKSSAGDKFETSREMMNQEISRIEERIAYLKKQINSLKNIPLKKVESIQNGSLVLTNHGLFFFGIAFGKLNLEAQDLMGLSLNSPLGKLMTDRKEGDELTFMDRNYLIQSVN
jgi:transcription elongation GreA/GreB family factor